MVYSKDDKELNFFDKYFEYIIEKRHRDTSYFVPNLFKKQFYEDCILLREDQADNDNLVKCDFKVMNIKGLINLDFI